MILALDLATKTGYAYRDSSGKIISGMWDFTAKKGEWVDKRYYCLYQDLLDLFSNRIGLEFAKENNNITYINESISATTIWYEEPTPQSTNARKVLYGLLAVVKMICYEYDITLHVDEKVTTKKNRFTGKTRKTTTYRGVAPKALKKWATNNGNASKEDMILAANKITMPMISVKDDNQADAICLLAYAEEITCN